MGHSAKGILCEGLSKSFHRGAVTAVESINLKIDQGELFGLIGPDGAGKTTLMRLLTTLLKADRGNATVDGLDITEDYKMIRQTVGYMPGRFSLYQDLTVAENLNFFATLFNTTVSSNIDLIHDIYVQIEPFSDRRAGQLSGGMKQKLALCCALIHKPTVLFLDEPTTGVDVVSRKEFWGMLAGLRTLGITILVSTPYMDEAMRCDRIALIQAGEIMQVNTPQGIIESYPLTLYAVKAEDTFRLLQDSKAYHNTRSCFAFGSYLHLTFRGEDPNLVREYMEYLYRKGHDSLTINKIAPTIEDCFMYLMNSKPMTSTRL
ncbi:ABC transporter ATP-binding protein [Dyadobacter tibetensis]|uniref:ABC transporter ATP-binding protein n=1 Tax=Dyadobacter tibetensis TaxID=1211851 RepID=UPI000471C719|nr:ABC transporter ATP-binding protein [Dyadobacter tibetensis]